jgi:hypothetical protein
MTPVHVQWRGRLPSHPKVHRVADDETLPAGPGVFVLDEDEPDQRRRAREARKRGWTVVAISRSTAAPRWADCSIPSETRLAVAAIQLMADLVSEPSRVSADLFRLRRALGFMGEARVMAGAATGLDAARVALLRATGGELGHSALAGATALVVGWYVPPGVGTDALKAVWWPMVNALNPGVPVAVGRVVSSVYLATRAVVMVGGPPATVLAARAALKRPLGRRHHQSLPTWPLRHRRVLGARGSDRSGPVGTLWAGLELESS